MSALIRAVRALTGVPYRWPVEGGRFDAACLTAWVWEEK